MELDQLALELKSLLPMSADAERELWAKFRLEWNYNSNHLEGNTLSIGETRLLLFFEETPGNHPLREIDEMRGHDVAVSLVRQWAGDEERKLSEADIRELQRMIIVRRYKKPAVTPDGIETEKWIEVGEYKSTSNHVVLPGGGIFKYAEPNDVPPLMEDLLDWYYQEGEAMHPLILATLFHYRFVRIHPFDDGNGRVSRLLLNYHLISKGMPPVVIPSAVKTNYLSALRNADNGDLTPLVRFVGEHLKRSLQISIKAAKGESIEEDEDWVKRLAVLEKRTSAKLNQPTVHVGKEILLERWADSFAPLRQTLIERFEQTIRPFFEEMTGWLHLDAFPRNDLGEFHPIEDWFASYNHPPKKLEWTLSFKQLKAHPEGFSVKWQFVLLLHPTHYTFRWGSTSIELGPKRYNETLSKDEIQSFVNRAGRDAALWIERNVGA